MEDLIQFKINDNYYEIYLNKNKEWVLDVVFGKPLKLSLKKFKGFDKKYIEELLYIKYPTIKIY